MVMRLQQQISDMQETVNNLQDAADLKAPKPACSEVSGQSFTIANRNHVSADNF